MEKSEIIDHLIISFTNGIAEVVANYPLATEQQLIKTYEKVHHEKDKFKLILHENAPESIMLHFLSNYKIKKYEDFTSIKNFINKKQLNLNFVQLICLKNSKLLPAIRKRNPYLIQIKSVEDMIAYNDFDAFKEYVKDLTSEQISELNKKITGSSYRAVALRKALISNPNTPVKVFTHCFQSTQLIAKATCGDNEFIRLNLVKCILRDLIYKKVGKVARRAGIKSLKDFKFHVVYSKYLPMLAKEPEFKELLNDKSL
jgi:hypothetical protein